MLDDGFETLVSVPRGMPGRVQVMLLAVLAVVATIVAVHRLAASDSPARITMSGLLVADPASVLDEAQQRFERYVTAQRGAAGDNAECWFQRPAGSPDVIGTLLCGPVQFYADYTDAPYLPFRLNASESNPIRLSIGAGPDTPIPVDAPVGTTLLRPDRTAVPLVMTALLAPAPQPADVDTLTTTNAVYPPNLSDAPATAKIGSETITAQLVAADPVLTYGRGAAARSAVPGMQLYAFRLVFRAGKNGVARPSQLHLGVAVGAATPRQLRLPDLALDPAGQLFVVAATPTTPLALVLNQHGVTQRLSLRTGSGPGTTPPTRAQQRLEVSPMDRTVPPVTVGVMRDRTRRSRPTASRRAAAPRGSAADRTVVPKVVSIDPHADAWTCGNLR